MPQVLVLCYHAVSDRWGAPLSVTPADLRRQLSALLSRGWVGARFTDAVLAPEHRRTLAVTFDDGFESVRTLAAPILAELGVPGTVFVATDYPGRSLVWPEVARWAQADQAEELRSMSWESLRALAASGWEIGSHTCSHPRLSEVDSAAIDSELQGSRAVCEQQLAVPCRSLAYPFGDADDRVRAAAPAAGYEAAAGLSSAAFVARHRFDWPRVGVWHGEPNWRFHLKTLPATSYLRRARWAAVADVSRKRLKAARTQAPADVASAPEPTADTGVGGRPVEGDLEPVHRRVRVTTLTPVYNEEHHVRETVAALKAQDLAEEAEFIFIDGRSTDRTRAILVELATADERIRVLDNPRGQTASALNIGLRAARGEYIARIDAHTRYPAHYLWLGIERLERGDVDWVAGPQVPVGTDTWSRRVAMALGTWLATGASNRWERDVARHGGGEVELATGVFTGVWRRATLERDGGWDEGWPVNQDSEMAARVLRRGGRIVSLRELAADYTPRNSLPALARQYRRYGMYRARTTLRHPWTARAPHVVLPGVVAAAAAAVVAPRPLRSASRAAVAVYAGLVGLESVRATTDPRDALALPLVLVTMHASWGAGFLLGLARFALPSSRRVALANDLGPRPRAE